MEEKDIKKQEQQYSSPYEFRYATCNGDVHW